MDSDNGMGYDVLTGGCAHAGQSDGWVWPCRASSGCVQGINDRWVNQEDGSDKWVCPVGVSW